MMHRARLAKQEFNGHPTMTKTPIGTEFIVDASIREQRRPLRHKGTGVIVLADLIWARNTSNGEDGMLPIELLEIDEGIYEPA